MKNKFYLPVHVLLVVCFCISSIFGQLVNDVSSLLEKPNVKKAFEYIREIEPETIEEQIKLTEIPAPTFQEQKRGLYFKKRFEEIGLSNVRIDSVGNVIGERNGKGGKDAPTLVLAAHLDTVFAMETKLETRREGTIIKLPGISDDGRGLTLLLAIAKTLEKHGIETIGNIIFVANVGEEGLGDLKGVRHLFNVELKDRITHFISIDGAGLGVTTGAVGSKRYRVTFSGRGGHSYGAFGMANPIHAVGRLIAKVSNFQTPVDPKTTFSVGMIRGGTSVNSIARTASFDIDMRSRDPYELSRLDKRFKQNAQAALDEENARWKNKGKIRLDIKLIGDRPTGTQPQDSPIIQVAASANKFMKIENDFGFSSTDSNMPISIGVPAITIDGGGKGKGAHSLDEQWDSKDSHIGSQRALLIALGVVGVQ
ncbi:MAG: M20/M25/M40 family metallo-hydrolase [Pyrinomonadaceae bacterium]|nr:M20/M25/M40 family metallo-hydrolase [Pyrinomonadaceae bacterium]